MSFDAHEISGQLFRCHTDTRIPNDQLGCTIFVLEGANGDVEVLCAAQNLLLGEGSDTKFFEGIVGVRDEFTKEDIPVRVKTVGFGSNNALTAKNKQTNLLMTILRRRVTSLCLA